MNLAGYTFNTEQGVVFGKKGKPVGRVGNRGYVEVSHGRSSYRAHRMIWQHVHGPIAAGMEINHKNGIKTDNRLANLELVTKSENALHASETGLTNYAGERNGRAKLDDIAVRVIRTSKHKTRVLAAAFGVSVSTINRVRAGRVWSHNRRGEA
jgi:hypothetical protein